MYKALYLSPVIPSYDLKATVRFLTEVLSFEIARDDETYMILAKNNLALHVCRAGDGIGEMAVYLEIDDLDGLWDSIKDKLTGVKVRPPFNQEYGMREFHVSVPQTNVLLFVGQEIV